MARNDGRTFSKINQSFYITSQKFINIIVFQVTFKLVMEWEGDTITLRSPFVGILRQQEMLKSLSFLSFDNITFNLYAGKSLLEEAKYFAHPKKNRTSWSIKYAKIHYHTFLWFADI